jgi:hypothetical protein
MLHAAAFVPIPPLLVPEIAGGSAATDDELRDACRAAVGRLIDTGPDEIIVIGSGTPAGQADGSWDWRGFGVPIPEHPPSRRLPLSLAIGSWLLDLLGNRTPRRHHIISSTASPADCAATGRDLVAGPQRFGLLVCGDGTACRTEKAPGYFDPTAQAWDERALAALRNADPTQLLALDPDEAMRLMAAGRAPWQVLAGAAGSDTFNAHIDWAAAPYGVMYVAGTWTRTDPAYVSASAG